MQFERRSTRKPETKQTLLRLSDAAAQMIFDYFYDIPLPPEQRRLAEQICERLAKFGFITSDPTDGAG